MLAVSNVTIITPFDEIQNCAAKFRRESFSSRARNPTLRFCVN
jgi:hypothetical protein